MLTIPRAKETLDFQLEGSEEIYSIPYAKDLSMDYVEELAALRRDPDGIAAMGLLHRIIDRYAPGVWEQLTQEGLALILGAWSGNLGEA